MTNPLIPPIFLLPGMIVAAPMKGWLGLTRHFALVTTKQGPDGLPVVVANSRNSGGPAEEQWNKFTEGQPHDRAYYPSALPPEAVLENAYRLFGTRYNLMSWNCEHFVNACHGLPATSKQIKQVRGFALAAFVGGLALAAARS
jgi:hypothetical protein